MIGGSRGNSHAVMREPAQVPSEISERYGYLIRTITRAGFAYLVGVGGMAATVRVIGVETIVRDSGNYNAVSINIDAIRSCTAPGEIHGVSSLHFVAARRECDLTRRRCRGRRGSYSWDGCCC